MPILLEKHLTFTQSRAAILKNLDFLRQDFSDYELVIENPCLAHDSDSYDQLDADRNENMDEEIKRAFTRMKNMERIQVGALADGTILILVKKEDQEDLNYYINEKSHETYVYLIEKDGVNRGYGFEK
jgi:hypothetical protein